MTLYVHVTVADRTEIAFSEYRSSLRFDDSEFGDHEPGELSENGRVWPRHGQSKVTEIAD